MPKATKYNLTEEEKTHLLSRKNVMAYIGDMIKNEMNQYILQVVRKRLDIPETIDIEIDIEHGTIKTKTKATND